MSAVLVQVRPANLLLCVRVPANLCLCYVGSQGSPGYRAPPHLGHIIHYTPYYMYLNVILTNMLVSRVVMNICFMLKSQKSYIPKRPYTEPLMTPVVCKKGQSRKH